MNIRSVMLAIKMDSREAEDLALMIKSWLKEKGCRVSMAEYPYQMPGQELTDDKPDLIIVLGGDGTILSVARSMLGQSAPFLGINLGKVGFLAEVSIDNWQEKLNKVFDSGFLISRRLVLKYCIVRGGQEEISGVGINELVISRGELARLISMDLESSQGFMNGIRADGLIFSTPTGSTAYCVSAGGPLVHPEMEGIILTPVCVFLHDFKPMVMPGRESFRIRVGKESPEAYLTIDGQTGYPLLPGDELLVSRHPQDLKLLMFQEEGFLAKLKTKKFFVGG